MESDTTASAPLGLRIAESPGRGRGVFATRDFGAGEPIERAPVVIVPRAQLLPLRGTLLDDYWFWWDEQHNACGFGWASFYNHDCPANARFECRYGDRLLAFIAVRAIRAGEEVTINYHGDPDDASPTWFAAR